VTRRRAVAAALTVAAVLGACRSGPSEDGAATPRPSATPTSEAATPSVEINFPDDDARLRSDAVFVSITVRSFRLVKNFRERPGAGRGHVIFYVDADPIPTRAGRVAITEDGRYQRAAATSHKWTNVSPGRHRLGVQLVNNDDTPLEPAVTDEVEVTVARVS
jgi:hypothetical protein